MTLPGGSHGWWGIAEAEDRVAMLPLPPFRAFLVGPQGTAVELLLVRGLDRDGKRWFHAFGPPGRTVGVDWRPVVLPRPGCSAWTGPDHIQWEVRPDARAGLLRFRPIFQIAQTCN
jgi:hypothetical protein